MHKRSAKRTAVTVAIAGGALIVLIILGACLRMRTGDMGFFQALTAFLKDTFTPIK